MVVTPPLASPKGGWIDCYGIANGKGEIRRARDEPYRAFFDWCSEGGCDEDGDEDGSKGRYAEAMASDACRNSSRYYPERWKGTIGESSQRATKEYLDEG